LVKTGKIDKATKALRWLHDQEDVDDDLYDLVHAGRAETVHDFVPAGRLYRDPTIYKPVLLAVIIMAINQMSGINVIITYTVDIFREAGVNISPDWSAVTVGLIQVIGTTVSIFVIKSVNRRPLLITSLLIMATALYTFGAYFWHKPGPEYGWIPIMCLVCFILAFSLGQGPLAWVLLGDLATPRAASLTGTAASATNWGVAFITTVSYDSMKASLGQAGTYWLYSSCCVAGALFVLLVVPETRGRSRQDIERIFLR